jgi:hypothetical protein
MPELALIDFSDPAVDGFGLLDAILQDPWLHYAGIVGFCDDHRVSKRLEKMQGINLLASVSHEEIEDYLPTILAIIGKNQRILFQRGIGPGLMQAVSGSFQIQNDPLEAACYANLLCNFLYNANKIDASHKMHVHVALVEMLLNAIEHGNCGINYQEKSAWLLEGNAMRDLIAAKCQDGAIRKRRVLFEYTIEPAQSKFLIADEGPGFDWRGVKDAARDENLEVPHGRGIQMTTRFTKNLGYNERGNAVSFEIEHQADCTNAQPAVFENMAPTPVAPGDVVFREGEPGDHMYYIAKGHFDVLVGDCVVSSLSADDVLMGEMAFLLNNRRTATVLATAPGALVRMSKRQFVEALKARPHYGLYLARLLAQRMQRGHVERRADRDAL